MSNPFYVDNEVPTGTVAISLNGGNILGTVNATDNGSGISSYMYALSTSNSCPSSGYTESTNNSYSFSVSSAGTYYICTKIKDKVGNVSDTIRSSAYTLSDMIAPTCSLSVSGTTITGSYADEGGSGVAYYGWNSSMTGTSSATKTIDGTGTYTFYVKDGVGNSKNCSLNVENTDHDDGYDYVGAGRAAAGYCICKNGNRVTCKMSGTNAVCSCPSGYSSNSCSVRRTCSSGWTLASNGITCYKWRGINYYCSSGYTKVNDSYCYKIN